MHQHNKIGHDMKKKLYQVGISQGVNEDIKIVLLFRKVHLAAFAWTRLEYCDGIRTYKNRVLTVLNSSLMEALPARNCV